MRRLNGKANQIQRISRSVRELSARTLRGRHPAHAVPHQRRQPGVGLAGARPDVGRVRRYRGRPRDQGAHPYRNWRKLQRQLGTHAQWGPGRKTRLPSHAGHPRLAEARRKSLVCTASDYQRARCRRTDDQRRQRTLQHALRGAAARRHRPGLRRRLLPGRLALSARPGARRRSACHLELFGRPHPRPLLPVDRHEARCAGGQGVGRSQRGAAQRPITGQGLGTRSRTGQAPTADAALFAPAVHQPTQAGLPRRTRPRPGPGNLRSARLLPVRRRDGTAGQGLGSTTLADGVPS